MTMSRIPAVLSLALGALTIFGSSCTLILAPRDDVQRCGSADDCDPTGDNRYVPICKFDDENSDLDSSVVDKICVADFRPNLGCDPQTYTDPAETYLTAFMELSDSARYTGCENNAGALGCQPLAGDNCQGDLEVNDLGVCDDDNPNTPRAYRADTTELFGQDVRDQFCRAYFCDDRFVCDTTTNLCVLCDDGEVPGEGGCGELYVDNQPSCAYQDADANCVGPQVTTRDLGFGCG